MTVARSHPELVTLRKLAQELATTRKERMTSVHLLAAMASRDGEGAALLRERRLDQDALLKATRSFDEDEPDAVSRVLGSARDFAKRAPRGEPSCLHLLLAILADRRCAAHRALVQSGVDLGRLRTAAMQLALGVVAARRPLAAPSIGLRTEPAPTTPRPTSVPTGVTVPLFPPPMRDRTAPPGASTSSPAQLGAPRLLSAQPPPNERRPEPPAPPPKQPPAAEPKSAAPLPRRANTRRASPGSPVRDIVRFALDRTRFPALASLGKNLTLLAAQGALERIVGRDAEIEHVLDILAKRHANSACLIGPAGVGKTSVARGVAHRFAEAAGRPRLLIEIIVSELVAGTGARGALAERIAAIRAELREAKGDVVLFVDEVHELFEGGALDEAIAEVKLALARGELLLVGATTPEQYRKTIEPDAALARRFTTVEVDEPDESDAFLLVRDVAQALGKHHELAYADEAIAASVSWSVRYLPGRALPDKAIAILDLAGARTRRRASGGDPAEAPRTGRTRPTSRPTVGVADVAHVVSELADLPVERLLETDAKRMLALESILADRVVGHAPALGRIASVLRRNAAGLRGRRPIGTFLLLGPTGVGKTETAKAIAEALFHNADAMTRLDLSEYAEPHAVARLIGAPPGYIGHEAGGQLTEAVRRRPYQVVLLDEIEKAHRDVLEAFLQVFDEGRLTDGRGRRVDFTNTVLVLTSNLGAVEARAIARDRAVGFARPAARFDHARLADAVVAAARAELPPELYNRIDEVLCYAPLGRAEVAEIARRLLAGLAASLGDRGVRLELEPAVVDALLDAGGFDPELGARPMKRTIARLIEAPLAELLLRGDLVRESCALVCVDRGEIVVDAVSTARTAAS